MNLIAEGLSLAELEACESLLPEGQKGEVRIYFDRSLTPSEVQQIANEILAEGVVLTGSVKTVDGILAISFQKMLAPLAIIVAVVGGLAIATILGWQLMSDFVGIPVWMWIVGGGLLVWALGKR